MRRFSFAILLFLLLLLVATPCSWAQKTAKEQFVLVIDPGHGGVDPGAIGPKGTKEKVVNLNVSRLLGEMINDKYPEVKIIYTRNKKDVKVPLVSRAKIANDANADLFISIHANAAKNRKARGCETFTLGSGSSAEAKAAAMYENEVILLEENFEQVYKGFDPRSSESYIIFELIRGHDMEKSISCAEHIQKNMVKRSKLQNRGVSSAGFLVLHRTVMPSILVELGFISNPIEEKYLASKAGQKELAQGIFDGFSNYYESYKKTKLSAQPVVAKDDVYNSSEPVISKAKNSKEQSPVFKVQILTSSKKLKKNDPRLKGLKADFYVEGGIYKYTYGESSNYNTIAKKRKEILSKFKEAFIVAFKNGKKVNTAKAIEEFKSSKK